MSAMIPAAFSLLFVIAGFAQENVALGSLESTLRSIRANTNLRLDRRGAPQMTTAKHQLRDWIESKLAPLPLNSDTPTLEKQLNDSLRSAKLFCEQNDACARERRDVFDETGYLGKVELRINAGLLDVRTHMGIICGYDESAYLYKWTGSQWERIWETERNDYAADRYDPQNIYEVIVAQERSSRGVLDDRLVLTLGRNPWCTSNWHRDYFRLWRVDQAGSRLILEGSDIAFGDELSGRIEPRLPFEKGGADTVLVQFTVRSIDAGILARQAIRQYAIKGDKVERVAPLAFNPRNFVDEWLTHSKSEAQGWSLDSSKQVLADWHDKLHRDYVSGDFIWPSLHCSQPDVWQVGLELNERDKSGNVTASSDYYFLVRWSPPYKFTMIAISEKQSPTCTERDPDADKDGSLFVNGSR
jgi:hypothetical protein